MDGVVISIVSAAVSGIISGFGAYMAIRIEIAILKHRMERADEDRHELIVRLDDAHERIDSLQRSRMKTIN